MVHYRKYIALALFILMGVCSVKSQSDTTMKPKKVGIKGLIGFGFTIPVYPALENFSYGIDNSIRSASVGGAIQAGLGLDFHHRFGLETHIGISSASTRASKMFDRIEEEYPDTYLQGDLNQDVTHSGGRGSNIGFYSANLYYVADWVKNVKLVCAGGVYLARPTHMSYQFVTIQPQTNYYTVHQIVSEKNDYSPLYNASIEFRKYFMGETQRNRVNRMHIGLKINSFFGKYDANYTIYHTDYAGVETEEKVVAPLKVIHFNITLSLCLFTF